MYLNNRSIALINQATDKTQGEPAIYYYQTNPIDAPLTLTDANQNTVWQAKQNGFKLNVTQADITQPLRFPGQLEDKETGYYYNYHRYYNPNTGRYITSDPIGLRGGMNRFGYVGGNPLMMVDPYGDIAGLGGKKNYKHKLTKEQCRMNCEDLRRALMSVCTVQGVAIHSCRVGVEQIYVQCVLQDEKPKECDKFNEEKACVDFDSDIDLAGYSGF